MGKTRTCTWSLLSKLYYWYIGRHSIIFNDTLSINNITTEFERDFKHWEKFVEAANKEKEWINQRITWFFTPQTILFATFSAINAAVINARSLSSSYMDILDIINIALPIIGIASSILVFLSILAAVRMHGIWHSNIKKIVSRYDPNEKDITLENKKLRVQCHANFTFGRGPRWPAWVSRWAPVGIIVLFAIAWSKILFCVLHQSKYFTCGH